MPGHLLRRLLHDCQRLLRRFPVRTACTPSAGFIRVAIGSRGGLDTFDGLIPFDFKTDPSDSDSKYLVNLLSMELTYFTCGLLFAAVVKRWVWDYAITVTVIHVAVTSAGCGVFLMICNGQLVAHFACQGDQSYPVFDGT
ncbi:uncharacterized protein [Ambystoma mexicanum]|uniref:uncharacterized protein isoform X2 n=1 Tax=Ambystoma mexicanum TaxID=8296 RepID=UPI0037E99A8B